MIQQDRRPQHPHCQPERRAVRPHRFHGFRGQRVPAATREEAGTMPVCSTWGPKVISVLAKRLFVKRQPLAN
jgi:hypothetical protein